MKKILVTFLMAAIALHDKGHRIEPEKHQTKTEALKELDDSSEQCKVFDACRACSFRELQKVEVCQNTGYRLIMKCKKGSESEYWHQTKSCNEAKLGSYDTDGGKLAIANSLPTSVPMFFLAMAVLALISYKAL